MKSMTGFGKETIQNETYQIDVEIKSVNQRFLDVQLRMPKEANSYELAIRQAVKDTLQRGRVEVYVNVHQTGSGNKEVQIHWPLIDQLLDEMQQHLQMKYPTATFDAGASVNQLLQQADFVEVTEKQEADEEFGELLLAAVAGAIAAIDESRLIEGQKIQEVLTNYAQEVEEAVAELNGFVTIFEQEYKDRFEAKLKDWLGNQVDETRLLTEMAILLEKGDVHEELDRLVIHTEKMRVLLQTTAPVGRELDFLIQEMNREVNTIGSKSSPIEIKNIVVRMKTTLEKIREQIQNVE